MTNIFYLLFIGSHCLALPNTIIRTTRMHTVALTEHVVSATWTR